MNNKNIKKQRIENYFIDAACELICKSGMSAVTIRNIADKAGYNSATLYTYFKTLSHLIAYASFRFEREMMIAVERRIAEMCESDISKIWPEVYIAMADFLLDNPNIFECNFISMYDGLTRDEVVALRGEKSEFAKFVYENLGNIAIQLNLDMKEIDRINNTCLSLIIGTVLLSIKERTAGNKADLLSELRLQVNNIIKFNLGAYCEK